VYEDEGRFCVQLALPGMESKAMEVHIGNRTLTVKGERKGESPEAGRTYHIREMDWGAFSRSFTLPSHVDAGRGSASFEEGMLTIVFPKYEEAKARRILIESK
jgi:HSP20 family protein